MKYRRKWRVSSTGIIIQKLLGAPSRPTSTQDQRILGNTMGPKGMRRMTGNPGS